MKQTNMIQKIKDDMRTRILIRNAMRTVNKIRCDEIRKLKEDVTAHCSFKLSLQHNNIDLIKRGRGILELVVGGVLVGLGAITLPLPTGSIFIIGIGVSLVTVGYIDTMLLLNSNIGRFNNKVRLIKCKLGVL